MNQITVSITEASRVLGLGRTTIYALIGRGALATVTIGRRRLIRVDSLHKLLEG